MERVEIMTNQEAIINLKVILSEIIECEESICYITDIDAGPLRLAIKALEKQVPKKHIVNDGYQIACPNCSATLIYCLHTYDINCCDKCGQRLDWNKK